VLVDVKTPAEPSNGGRRGFKDFPVESKMSVWSGVTGTAKLAWFRMLKNSARNCTLKLSEIFLMGTFLNMEKSRFDVPGPIRMLRPELPRRLKHWGGVPMALESKIGSELHIGVGPAKNDAGAVGIANTGS